MKFQYRIIYYNILFSLLFCGILFIFNLEQHYEIMMLYAIICIFMYGGLLYDEIKQFKGIRINILILVAFIMRFVIPLCNKSIEGVQYDSVSLGEDNDISNSIFETSILMNLYYSIIYFFFLKYSNKVYIEDYVKPYLKKYNITLVSIVLFFIGTIYNVITSFIPNTLIPYTLANIFGNLSMMAILLQMLNASIYPTKQKSIIYVILIIIEVLRCFLFGFMKGPIMYALSFYILYTLLKAKYEKSAILTIKNALLVLSAFLFLNYIVTPFISIKRDVAQWDIASGGIIGSSYSNMDILENVLEGKYEKEENHPAIDRLDALSNNAFFINYTKKNNTYNYEFINESLHELIPRFLNDNKHPARKGLMATSILKYGNSANYDNVFSNSYIGQTASAYMLGGFMMVVFLAILNGFVISKYYVFLIKHINNFFAAIFLVQLLILSLTGFEEIHDGGLLRCSLFIIYIVLISILNKIKFFKLSI